MKKNSKVPDEKYYRDCIRVYVDELTNDSKNNEIDIAYLINYIKLLGIPVTTTSSCILFDLSKLDNQRLCELYNFVQTIKRKSASISFHQQENTITKYKKELQSYSSVERNDEIKSRESFLKTPIVYDEPIKFTNINNKKNISPYFLQIVKPLRKQIRVSSEK